MNSASLDARVQEWQQQAVHIRMITVKAKFRYQLPAYPLINSTRSFVCNLVSTTVMFLHTCIINCMHTKYEVHDNTVCTHQTLAICLVCDKHCIHGNTVCTHRSSRTWLACNKRRCQNRFMHYNYTWWCHVLWDASTITGLPILHFKDDFSETVRMSEVYITQQPTRYTPLDGMWRSLMESKDDVWVRSVKDVTSPEPRPCSAMLAYVADKRES